MDEVEKFAQLGKWFFERLGLPGKFNIEVFCQTWKRLIETNTGYVIGRFDWDGNPVEALGAIEYPDVFYGTKTACNMFWFFLEEPKGLEAGMLYRDLEILCKERDVKVLFIGVLCNERLSKVGGFLLKSGYQLTEMQYRKEL